MRNFFRILSLGFTIVICIVFSMIVFAYNSTAESYLTEKGKRLDLNLDAPLSVSVNRYKQSNTQVFSSSGSNIYSANIFLFNLIPIRQTNIAVTEREEVIPCATPFGIKIYTQGVLVVAMSDVKCDQKYVNPAKDAGLCAGDVITAINEKKINTNDEISDIIKDSNGSTLKLDVKRGDREFETELKPIKSFSENCYKAGLWVRDSCAGIGTLTFFNPKINTFAGLGHGICDVDTGELLPLLSGDIVKAKINNIVKGESGTPGELRGSFKNNNSIGTLYANTQIGVYGTMEKCVSENKPVKVALKQEVQRGAATILSTIDGETPGTYDIEIEEINYNTDSLTKNMIIKITSPELLEKTGGIVQGMSGSPIIQNNMLVGAVTHVFINDPQRGYAIFAETMLNQRY